MISYSRDIQTALKSESIKIIGLGGAGVNMLERLSLENLEGADLLAINTDTRTLHSSTLAEKIQIGPNLTRGLGTGGDPDLGYQAIIESDKAVRNALKGKRIIFLCVGLGGGTGSGAAAHVAKMAREEGALVIIFATMPFSFEGRRRIEQAGTALNQLSVLSNALIVFDNNRMGELILSQNGIHEAFAAGDRMISESIKAVIRLIARPGLINVGLDDLMTALRSTQSRCLFGSGVADGDDRSSKALKNALSSPLLDQGALLKKASNVLVHLSGGESVTLFEIEQLMKSLDQYIPKSAHILFGVAIDPSMGDQISITLISSLPEELMNQTEHLQKETQKIEPVAVVHLPSPLENQSEKQKMEVSKSQVFEDPIIVKTMLSPSIEEKKEEKEIAAAPLLIDSLVSSSLEDDLLPFAEIPPSQVTEQVSIASAPEIQTPLVVEKVLVVENKPTDSLSFFNEKEEKPSPVEREIIIPENPELTKKPLISSTKIEPKKKAPQSELLFDHISKGRFEGGTPNLYDGEDLDLPPFLRKKSP